MRVIIIGAGEVGQTLAENLSETHEVALVDQDEDLIDDLSYELDLLTVHGDGTELSILKEAGLEQADMVIACTDDDQTNIVACGTAKSITDAFTVARVKQRGLLETWKQAEEAYNVDFMVCSDLLAAEAIFRIAGVPDALDLDTFGSGLVRMAEFEIPPDSPIANISVEEADTYESLTFAAVIRDDRTVIPRGSTMLEPGDRIVVIGAPENVRELAEAISKEATDQTEEVVIIGGSQVGFQTAKVFEEHGYQTRLIERDKARARQIAEELPNTVVIQHDATDVEFLEREHVDEADLVVTALNSDEKNLLVALLADRIGVQRTVSLVHQPQYGRLFETVGIDVAVSPREETAEEITRYTRQEGTEKVAMIGNGSGEVVELQVGEESLLADRSIADSVADLSDRVVIGAVTRDGKYLIPRGDTVLQSGDHLVIFAHADDIDKVLQRI